jgi:hypothetical protein
VTFAFVLIVNLKQFQVFANNSTDCEEIARKAFLELEQHKASFEETKASIDIYTNKLHSQDSILDVKDLLAQGEEVLPTEQAPKKKIKLRRVKDDSDSEMEDWEEVKGIQ